MNATLDILMVTLVAGGIALLFLRRVEWNVLGELMIMAGAFVALFPKGLYLAAGMIMLHSLLFVQWGQSISISGLEIKKPSVKQWIVAVFFGIGCLLLSAQNQKGMLGGQVTDTSSAMSSVDVQGMYLAEGLPYLAVVLLTALLVMVFLLVERRKR